MIEKIVDIIFPKKCLICGKSEGKYLCDDCYKKMNLNFKFFKINNSNFEYLCYLEKYKR